MGSESGHQRGHPPSPPHLRGPPLLVGWAGRCPLLFKMNLRKRLSERKIAKCSTNRDPHRLHHYITTSLHHYRQLLEFNANFKTSLQLSYNTCGLSSPAPLLPGEQRGNRPGTPILGHPAQILSPPSSPSPGCRAARSRQGAPFSHSHKHS